MVKISATVTCQYNSDFSPYLPSHFEEALDWAADSGLDGVEICIGDYRDLDVDKIQKNISRRHLLCSTISTGQALSREGISLTHPDKEIRNRAKKRLCEHIDAASILGSRVTVGLIRGKGVIVSGNVTSGAVDDQTASSDSTSNNSSTPVSCASPGDLIHILADELSECGVYAASQNVTLLLEPINRNETALLCNNRDMLNFLNLLSYPGWLKILWDSYHVNVEKESIFESLSQAGKNIGHVHLADSDRSFPGYGEIDFPLIWDALKKIGYMDWISFECLDKPAVSTNPKADSGRIRKEAGPFAQMIRNTFEKD